MSWKSAKALRTRGPSLWAKPFWRRRRRLLPGSHMKTKSSKMPPTGESLESFGKKINENSKKCQGAVLMAGASRTWKIVNEDISLDMTDQPGRFYDFSQASSFVRSTAVCSSTFHRHFLQLLNPYHTISAVTALQTASQLGNACSTFCVLCDDHLSIDRTICPFFAWPAIVGMRISCQTTEDVGYCFIAAPMSCHHT